MLAGAGPARERPPVRRRNGAQGRPPSRPLRMYKHVDGPSSRSAPSQTEPQSDASHMTAFGAASTVWTTTICLLASPRSGHTKRTECRSATAADASNGAIENAVAEEARERDRFTVDFPSRTAIRKSHSPRPICQLGQDLLWRRYAAFRMRWRVPHGERDTWTASLLSLHRYASTLNLAAWSCAIA